MIFGKKKTQKKVLVYSMNRDGSGAVYDSLSICHDVAVRQVFTLDRAKVTNMMLRRAEEIPAHILESDRILREELAGDTPFYFITMVPEPFSRHIRQCFYQLQHRVAPDALAYSLADPQRTAEHFDSVPAVQTTQWFQNEYFPATGIDVFRDPFDCQKGYQEFSLGAHRLMLVSAHLQPDVQTRVISDFLGVKIPPILEEKSPLDGLRDLFMAQVLTQNREKILHDFWFTQFSQHFFSVEQIAGFQHQADEISRRILALQDTVEGIKSANARDMILADAVSPLSQVPHLTAKLEILLNKRGVDATVSVVDGILRQMERARNNLLLSALRAVAAEDVPKAISLGEVWIDRPQDVRAIKAVSAYWQRRSAISRPLELLGTLTERDEKTMRDIKNLESQHRLLESPFPFSTRQSRAFSPAKKSVIYNPHQSLPFHTSGYATRTHGIVKGLQKCGWSINIVSRAGYPLDTGIDPQGLESHLIEDVPYKHDLQRGRGQWDLPLEQYIDQAAGYLVEQAKLTRPEIIHTASNFICGLAGVEAARRLGLPSIYEMRGLWHITRWSKDPGYSKTDKFVLAQKMELEAAQAADHVLAITGALKEWLVEHGIRADKISLAPNAVDLSQFQVQAPDLEFSRMVGCDGKIVVGYIGSFVEYEGLDLLVRAVAMLPSKQREAIRLLWIGDGPALGGLLELARDLSVADIIISLGRRPFEEVPRAYSIVDISAFPRKGQAICEIVSPLKPFEAMAMEKAVIVSDVRPLKEIVMHKKTGLIHRKDDAASLSQQLSLFITDKKLRRRCGEAARVWIEKTRQWDIIAAEISDVYRKLS